MGKYQVEVYNCTSLTVRTGASVSNKAIAWVQRGQKFTSSKQHSSGWMYIDEKKGWVSGKYLKKIKDLTVKAPPKQATTQKKTTRRTTSKKESTQKIDKKAVDAFAGGGAVSMKTASQSKDKYTSQSSGGRPVTRAVYSDEKSIGIGGYMDYSDFSTEYANLKVLSNVLPNIDITPALFLKFNRFKLEFPDHVLAKTFSYVFFTRPELNLFTEDGADLRGGIVSDPFFYQMNETHPTALRSLTRHFSTEHKFHPFLSNISKSFEVPDETLKTLEHGETLVGHKINYGKSNIEAHVAGTFSIQYEEDYEFNVYVLHKIWVEYISRVYRGAITASRDHIFRKILDYACSVYYFVCGPDGETILFWSKYFGVFPTNVPTSASSWTKGSTPKPMELNLTYAYSMKEDMMPATLYEFNMLASDKFVYEPIYNKQNYSVGRSITGNPYIEKVTKSTGSGFKLRFRVDE